jgi:hypothetical protein
MAQLLRLPDARPLDERLGNQFFREGPADLARTSTLFVHRP